MSVFTFNPRPTSGQISGNPPSKLLQYLASGSDDIDFVNSYALSASPAIASTAYGTLYRQDVQVQKVGHKLFDVDVPYGPSQNATGSYSFSFDTTGAMADVTVSLETVNTYKAAGEANDPPDHNRAIDVQPDGEVRGTKFVIPASRFSVTFRHSLGVVTIPFFKNLANYTGVVNSDTFLTFAAGELLFMGATGSDGSSSEAEVTYRFLASPNVTGKSFGDIANVAKKGHEVAWISFKKDVSNDKGVRKPQYCYVERIYETTDFALALGWS